MKINKVLSLSIFLMLSCGSTDNGPMSKENMAIFDGCTLFFRGIDDCGYSLYALRVLQISDYLQWILQRLIRCVC